MTYYDEKRDRFRVLIDLSPEDHQRVESLCGDVPLSRWIRKRLMSSVAYLEGKVVTRPDVGSLGEESQAPESW